MAYVEYRDGGLLVVSKSYETPYFLLLDLRILNQDICYIIHLLYRYYSHSVGDHETLVLLYSNWSIMYISIACSGRSLEKIHTHYLIQLCSGYIIIIIYLSQRLTAVNLPTLK